MSTADEQGAAAAARYFMHLYAYIYATGDTTTWRSMSAPTCTFCEQAAADAEALAAAGKRGGAPVTIVSAEGQELKQDEWFKAKLRVEQPPTVETDASGTATQTSEGGTFDVDFSLTWAGTWVVDSVGINPVSSQ